MLFWREKSEGILVQNGYVFNKKKWEVKFVILYLLFLLIEK